MYSTQRNYLVKYFLLFSCLVGMYSRLGVLFPYDSYIIPGTISFVFFARSWSALKGALFLSVFVFFHLVFVFLTDGSDADLMDQMSSAFLLLLALVSSLGFYSLLLRFSYQELEKIFLYLLLFVFTFALLERIGLTRGFSDGFRALFYDDSVLYKATTRDVASYGFIRPNVFASEPSYAAQFFSTVLVCYLLLRLETDLLVHATVTVFLFLFLLPSVTVLAGYLLYIYSYVIHRVSGQKSISLKKIIVVVGCFFLGLLLVRVIAIRLGFFGGDLEVSAYIRLLEPARLALESLRSNPLFGFGVGADNRLFELIDLVRSSPDTPEYIVRNVPTAVIAGSLLFSSIWQFGLVGLTLLVIFTRRYLGILSFGAGGVMIFWILLLGFSIADFHTPVLWSMVIPVAASIRRFRSSHGWHAKN